MGVEDLPRPRNYKPGTGSDRYARFVEDWLGIESTEVLEKLSKSLNENKHTLAVGGNGVSKSYSASALGIAALYCNPNTVVPITAGNGDTLKNSIWKPIKSLWRNSELPGAYKDNDRSLHTEFDDEWFLECHSPKHPEDLEGDHNANVIYIIEEAEKPGVTGEHIDSARSTLGDDDHILVLCNPPTDESNIVYELEQRDSWNVLRFPTWESRNARVDRGLTDKPRIGGLSGVGKMEDDWAEYHDEEWPGIDRVIEWSSPYLTEDGEPTVRETEAEDDNPEFRTDLHEKWYKRRAGVMPPQGAETWRPWSVGDVDGAYNRPVGAVRLTPEALGVDVADETDWSKAIGLHGPKAELEFESQDTLPQQQADLVGKLQEWPKMDGCVDAIGSGRQLAQELTDRFQGFNEFGNNEVPTDDGYRDKWAHGLALIGEWLRDGGSFSDKDLYEELKIAARVVKFERNHLRSRGDVIEATSKEEVKERLGRSPDTLDALLMALYARETDGSDSQGRAQQATISF